MIIKDRIFINNKEFVKIYSDKGCYITRKGIKYINVINPIIYADRIFEETDEKII